MCVTPHHQLPPPTSHLRHFGKPPFLKYVYLQRQFLLEGRLAPEVAHRFNNIHMLTPVAYCGHALCSNVTQKAGFACAASILKDTEVPHLPLLQ